MELVIVTGMPRAGKTIALRMLEDSGFCCADNLPISLVDEFAQLTAVGSDINQVALDIDIRSGEELSQLGTVLRGWRELGMDYQILFLDANDGVLTKRYKETHRSHPLARTGRLDKGIKKKRVELAFLKKDADLITGVDKLLTKGLRQELEKILLKYQEYRNMFATVFPFGFKYGTSENADLVFDVYFLFSLYYSEDLRLLTGEGQSVRDYVMQGGTCAQFLDKLYDMMDFLLSNYVNKRRDQLTVAVGCTGGKHRSVAVVKALCVHLIARAEYGTKIEHRDIDEDSKRR